MTIVRKLFIGCALMAALLIVASSAQAQRPGGGRGGFGRGPGGPGGPGGGSPLNLLGVEAIQKELELSEDQIAKFKEIGEGMRSQMQEMFSGLRDLPQEERRAKFEELRGKMESVRKELEGKIDGVLLAHQKERLQQINLQIRGIGALSDEKVAKELGISDEQKEKIAAAREESQTKMREQMRELFQNRGQDTDRDAIREKMQALRSDSDKAVLAVLSSEQQAKFEKMKGPKFEIDMRQLFQGRGGPGRGQRPGGNNPQPKSSQDLD